MTDRNPSADRARLYQQAFTAVMGDPFAPEDITDETTTGPEPSKNEDEQYQRIVLDYPALKGCSPLQAQRYNFGFGRATNNPLRPSVSDFICDTERIIANEFTKTHDKKYLQSFMDLYLYGDVKASPFTDKQRRELEQRIGRLFLFHGMSPTSKYFSTVRRPSPELDRLHKEEHKNGRA